MMLPRHRVLTASSLSDIKTAFNENFGFPTVPGSHDTLNNSVVKIKWNALMEKIRAVEAEVRERVLGLYFAYGLKKDETDNFRNFVLMIEYLFVNENMELDVVKRNGEPITTTTSPRGFLAEITLTDRNTLASQYFTNVKLKDSSGVFQSLKDGVDHIGIYYLLFENLYAMAKDNGITEAGDHTLEVSCTSLDLLESEVIAPITRYRHMVALNFEGDIDDHVYSSRFKNRGTDYGSVCPPNCPKRH